jgi:tRNA pseudouridine55 synthase
MIERNANSLDSLSGSKNTVLLYKKLGETPLECILRYKHDTGEKRAMTYAGRLDPLAEGGLLCLIGDECKRKNDYLSLNKKYTFEILVGISTDTHDLLGVVVQDSYDKTTEQNIGHDYSSGEIHISSDIINPSILQEFVGKRIQKYPAYSSKTINGVQLHTLARANKLDEIDIPSREVEIFDLKIIGKNEIDAKDLLDNILHKVDLVKGDFRQDIIKKKWQEVLGKYENARFFIYKIDIFCSSGTYVRALIRDLGKKLGIPMCAYSIKRTAVGNFVLPLV